MNKIVSDAKDGSVQIIALSYNNLGDEASSFHMVNKEAFEQTVAKLYIHIFVKSNLIDCSTQYWCTKLFCKREFIQAL